MTIEQNKRALDVALNTDVISLEQFNAAMDVWSRNRSKDGAFILLENGYVTKAQYDDLMEKLGGLSGVSFEHFSIEGVVGRGGAGRVYMARDERIGREVAIKEISPQKLAQDPERTTARFLREAKLSGRLDHPGIVPVYELSKKEDGSYFYVMKYVKGKTFLEAVMECFSDDAGKYLARRLLLLDKFISAAEAIGFAHSKGVIHRDLKPGNVVLGEFGEVVILDWGLAKSLNDGEEELSASYGEEYSTDDEGLTHVGAKLGTPAYMSPEQIDAKFGSVDARSDVYSLGVLLYLLLTGKKAYSGKAVEVMKTIAGPEKSPSPRSECPLVPPELSAICEKAMNKQQNERFKDAWALANELKAYRSDKLVGAYSYSRSEMFRRFLRQNRAAVIAAALVMFSIIVGAGFSVYYAIDAHQERILAERSLVEVTGLSESTMKLSTKVIIDIDQRIKSISESMGTVAEDIAAIGLMRTGDIEGMLEDISKSNWGMNVDLTAMKGGVLSHVASGDRAPSLDSLADYSSIVARFKLEGGVIRDLVFDEERRTYEFIIRVPVFASRGVGGILSADISVDQLIALSVGFDPRESPYQIWVMDMSGNIIYDEDPAEIGKELFSDRMYENFPELRKFGESMLAEPWGVGHYNFHDRHGNGDIYKIAAWDTVEAIPDSPWKVVVTYPYRNK